MIQVRNLNYHYKVGGKHAVKDMNFDIEQGEIFGFLGPSGAGKTTSQRLLIGLLSGYEGSIRIWDKERRDYGRNFFESIGVAFDYPNLYLKLTALENLKLMKGYYKKPGLNPMDLLEEVGLGQEANKRVELFSKGMKMRLNFIRALQHNPDLLFFDEPTSGLDPVNAKVIKDKIIDLKNSGKTIFLTTHNMTVATQLCDRVAFVSDGILKAVDTPGNLMYQYGHKEVALVAKKHGHLLETTYPLENLGNNQAFLEMIQSNEVHSIHTLEASLEDVFIKVTGKGLVG